MGNKSAKPVCTVCTTTLSDAERHLVADIWHKCSLKRYLPLSTMHEWGKLYEQQNYRLLLAKVEPYAFVLQFP
jgi:hypothetical protein